MKAHDMNTESAANDLTQLSSREQLSALMDGALPPDQTRFLLRRLQHDAPLAECWERWRLYAEVMRGLAPARRLPADFATRVSTALHGEAAATPQTGNARTPAWLRWGGAAAMAASLAVVALMARQPSVDAPADTNAIQLASAAAPISEAPGPAPVTQDPPGAGSATQVLVAATAVAATARPQRNRTAEASRASARLQTAVVRDSTAATQIAANELPIPQPDIVTRPWPRSVLPQYAGNPLAAGFGEHIRAEAPYNPFESPALAEIPPPAASQSAPESAPADASGRP